MTEPFCCSVRGVWMFQSETDLSVRDEETIVQRINKSLELAHHYRYGWE